ncbi:MAG: hypothetical protein AB7V46_22860 [Thermomicrobiales bacterium]
MPFKTLGLLVGDQILIKYRMWSFDDLNDEPADRWIRAEILESEPDAWPLARLVDGQLTEIRPYMTWRLLSRTTRGGPQRMVA